MKGWATRLPMRNLLLWAVCGALSFWIPVVVIFAIEGTSVNVGMANLVALLGISLCWGLQQWLGSRGWRSLWMLGGLYFLGPIFLTIATTFSNGGFSQMHRLWDVCWLLLACVLPPLGFWMAAMSGLWPSLLVTTLALVGVPAAAFRFARRSRRRPSSNEV